MDAAPSRRAESLPRPVPGDRGGLLTDPAPPARATLIHARRPSVVECLSAAVLQDALDPAVGLALWRRPVRASLYRPTTALLTLPPFSQTAVGCPGTALRALMRALPLAARPLGADIGLLARLFATLTGESEVRLRLEHVADDACRRHHVDSVRLRLLCTYAGAGTEWLDESGQTHRMPMMHVGVFKGSAFPDTAPRVLHRSPPVAHLPPHRRSRLLLCIDQPRVF
jgi:Protein of unknown function (DUF1826)